MKSSKKQRQADYILLYTILGKYLEKGIGDEMTAPRFLKLENMNEIVEPFHELKFLIQRIEWLNDGVSVKALIKRLVDNSISIEELMWAIDMFALQERYVVDKIKKENAD